MKKISVRSVNREPRSVLEWGGPLRHSTTHTYPQSAIAEHRSESIQGTNRLLVWSSKSRSFFKKSTMDEHYSFLSLYTFSTPPREPTRNYFLRVPVHSIGSVPIKNSITDHFSIKASFLQIKTLLFARSWCACLSLSQVYLSIRWGFIQAFTIRHLSLIADPCNFDHRIIYCTEKS